MTHIKTILVLVLVTFIALVVRAGSDSASAETAYNNYRKAIIDGDLESFRKYVPAAKLKDWESADAAQKLSALRQTIPADIEINGISVSGKKATILAKSGNASGTAKMALEQGEWKFSSETWDGSFTPPARTAAQPGGPRSTAPPDSKKPVAPVPAKDKPPAKTPATSESAAVKTAYENYRKAIFAGDFEALKKYVVAEKIKELGDDPKEKLQLIQGFMPADIKITDLEVTGNTATIYVQGTTMMGPGYATVTMTLEDDQWKVALESWKAGDLPELTAGQAGVQPPKKREPVALGVPGRIAFIDNRDGPFEIYTMNADGTGTKRLTKQAGGSFKKAPVWSPDGRKIAYVAEDLGSDTELYVVEADGSNFTQLTNNDADDSDPAWSPDSDKIVFKSSALEAKKTYEDGAISTTYREPEIFIVNSDGTGLRQITENGKVSDSNLAWSPDGTQIAFVSLRDNHWNIYLINTDGSNEQKLTSGDWDTHPAWSPDGNKIAFLCRLESRGLALAIINRDGSGQKTLAQEKVQRKPLAWSPDGSQILFLSTNTDHFTDDACVINADGSDFKRITNTKQQEESPSWSPDGQWVCFRRDFELYIVKSDGSGEEFKVSDERGCESPAWSPR